MGAKHLMWLKSSKVLLIIIFLIGLFFRVYGINNNPPGFSWDEAALGYNGYSILKTGRDEYGEILPLIFKSFGDYKPGVYVYLTVPFIAIFGLNELAVRLPSIILGSLIPILGYLIAKRIFLEKGKTIGIILAFVLAISPWLIHFSRSAWETNVALFESLLALYFLHKSLEGSKKYLILGTIFLGLTIFTYQSAKLFSLGLFFGFVFLNKNILLKGSLKKITLASGGILLLLLVISLSSSEVRSRLVYLNQFSYPRKEQEVQIIKKEEVSDPEFSYQLFHSQILENTRIVTDRYLSYFSFKFLFTNILADGRQGILNYGLFHLLELPFFVFGLIYLLKKNDKRFYLIWLWILLAPLPGALSREVVSTVRSLPLSFGISLIIAFGLFKSWDLLKNLKKVKIIIVPILSIFLIISLVFFIDRLNHNPLETSESWLYGHKEAVSFIENNKSKYDKVYFTTNYGEPYIFYLFYTKYSPSDFQKQAKLVTTNLHDVGEMEKIDKIEFVSADIHKYRYLKNILLVGSDLELQETEVKQIENANILKQINFLDGKRAFSVVEIK